MERTVRSASLLRSICLIFVLYLIHASAAVGDSRDEYLLGDESLSPISSDFTFKLLTKRETPDEKKDLYKEKKVKTKSSLFASRDQAATGLPTSTPPQTTTRSTGTTGLPTTSPDKKSKFTTEAGLTNTTLEDLPFDIPSNFSNSTTSTDYHVFYNSTMYGEDSNPMQYWVNMDDVPPHSMLSYSHRRATTVSLSFDFPFYGYVIRNVTIATGGFLYTGDYMHTWLAATQYIAPLMANFDTSMHNDSTIKYKDNGTSFTVQWEDVYLKDKNSDGPFTFQVTLKNNGDITFVYKSVAVPVNLLDDSLHPVKVGLSDAYIINRVMLFIRRKTIYEYHRVNMKSEFITNNTAILFSALPTCYNYNTCDTCMASNLTFDCLWCQEAERCSNGFDRNRQDWLDNTCHEVDKSSVKCEAATAAPPVITPSKSSPTVEPTSTKSTVPEKKTTNSTIPASGTEGNATESPVSPVTAQVDPIHDIPSVLPPKVVTLPNDPQDAARVVPLKPEPRVSDNMQEESSPSSVGAGAVVSILLIVIVVSGFAIWIIYAYKFPQSPSGQLLIRYRPSQWRWRHGEARYTAASIHI